MNSSENPRRSDGWASLWAGDVEAAHRFVREHPDDPSAGAVLGVAHLLAGRPSEALTVLERELARDDHDDTLVLHRVRALVNLDRLDEARKTLSSLGDGETFARRVLIALVDAKQWAGKPADFRRVSEALAESETYLNGLLSTALPAIVGRSALHDAFSSREALSTLLEDLLARMAGNLGLPPTVAETTETVERRFVPLAVPETTRDAASAPLRSLASEGVTETFAAFDRVFARHPRSVHVRCYRGELHLWLGRWDDAWADFAWTDSIERTRWADIGRLAVLTLTGRLEEAGRLAVETEQRFPPIARGTLPVYRGALRRRTGALEGAIADLEHAVSMKPSRLGARIELCLALRSAGKDSSAHAARIVHEAAPLLIDVADARGADWRREPTVLLDDAVLEDALLAMRGNRSSSLVTWMDRAQHLRILQTPSGLAERAQRILSDRRGR